MKVLLTLYFCEETRKSQEGVKKAELGAFLFLVQCSFDTFQSSDQTIHCRVECICNSVLSEVKVRNVRSLHKIDCM